MQCKKCSAQIPDESRFCCFCGKSQTPVQRRKKRGNGQGYVYKAANGTWRASVTLGYIVRPDGTTRRKTRTKCGFHTKKEALAAIPELLRSQEKTAASPTFKALYDKWLPTHRAGKSTMGNYKAAVKYFEPIWFMRISDIDIEDLQECVDDCPRGRRTRENMKALCNLIYKFGIPRHVVPENLNLAPFLVVTGGAAGRRPSFSDEEIEKIRKSIGTVSYADYIYCMIYLGFRPSEALALTVESYNVSERYFVGGAKTEAGTNRIVTVSPKIQPYINAIIAGRTSGPVFINKKTDSAWQRQSFADQAFYPALEAIGIHNPIIGDNTAKRHKYTPHSCRHTFSTLMKRVQAPDKDKLELIGHTSTEMLRYYEDVSIADLREITDSI